MEAIWIWKLLGELGFTVEALIVICYDNQSEIQVADTHVSHCKMKHVELHVHYLRQLVHDHVVSLLYCRTNDQVVDIFMKSVSKTKFIKFHDLLRLQEDSIMGGCVDVISPLEPLEHCANGGGIGTCGYDGST